MGFFGGGHGGVQMLNGMVREGVGGWQGVVGCQVWFFGLLMVWGAGAWGAESLSRA